MLFLFRTNSLTILIIRELLIENGDMDPDGDIPIKTEFNLTSFRCLVTILKGFTVDLRNSNFKELIGFEREMTRELSFGPRPRT